MSGFSGEFLYLHATDADVAHAQQQNGIGAGAGTVPFGLIGVANPHYEPGFRLGATKAFNDFSSLVVTYTFYESETLNNLAAPVLPGNVGTVGSLVHHPLTLLTSSAGPVNSYYNIDFQLADFAYRALWKGNKHYALNWSVGGRYGNLSQVFAQSGQWAGANAGQVVTSSNIEFHGGGLLFGLDGERRLGCSGFSIYSRGSLSPMSGRVTANYQMNRVSTAERLATAAWKDDRIITMLDCEAGISWTGQQRKWRLSAGYMASFWFNTATTAEFINTVQANSYDNVDDTLKFDGITARVERRW